MKVLESRKEVSLDYAIQGSSLGTPVLFLHGYTDSRRSFDRIMARIPRSIYGIAVSQRGHGDSARPEEDYSPSTFAADVAALMDRLKLRQAVIVGHSMGATVAQRFAIDFPERIRGLVLVGSFFTIKNHEGVQEFWDSTVAKLEDPVDPQIVRSFQESTIATAVPSAFLETVIQESLKVPARVWKSTLRALLDVDFTPELRRILVPTLLVWGDQDTYASRGDQDRLLAAIPGSRLSVYQGIGHSPQWEDPARFVTEVTDFVSR